MSIIYNPTTRTPYNYMAGIHDVTDDDFACFYKRRAKASMAEAEQLDICRHVWWYDGDRLMQSHMTGASFWRPVTDAENGLHVSGINWGTQYFLTEEAATRFREAIVSPERYQVGWPAYDAIGDVWSVHYHY